MLGSSYAYQHLTEESASKWLTRISGTWAETMVGHIRKFFYWPTITIDSMNHIRSCDTCQKLDKSKLRQMMMQVRELVTVPSERVAIDQVGPFPTAKGGFRYLLTYIDLATR